MKKIAYIIFVVPVVISFIFGGYVLSDVLGQPDRQLNMWQFKFITAPQQVGDKDIRIVNFTDSYSIATPLSFAVRVNDTSFDCGDLYMTVYGLDSSPKQVISQNAYFSQCFVQGNSTLPVNDIFSPAINRTGLYQIVAEMKDKSYQNSINVTANFRVQ